jgi:hypothetical protein
MTAPLIEEIKDNWKLEAKSENTNRYFFHVNEVEKILEGKRCYVIGRKGTGKTAISEHIAKIKEFSTFSEKLTFKNFPFNELYILQNNGYTAPNQYITLWKYIIYSFVCKMMAKNEAVDGQIGKLLASLYAPDPVSSLQKWIKKWTANDFGINILGTGGKVGMQPTTHDATWIERVDTLEEIIAKYADSSTYYVIFDELDEDYKNIMEADQYKSYTALLTGLFKAVQDVKTVFKDSRFKISPIIFLRDDIYSLISDADKTKWDDFKIDLDWDENKIKQLLAFRISRAIDSNGEIMTFENAWGKLFVNKPVMIGNRQREESSIFDFITRNTYLRPRDYTKYLQACAEANDEKYSKVHPTVVKTVGKQFSNYLKRELEDEIHGVIPNIAAVLDVISQIRKQTFSISEFNAAYNNKFKDGIPGKLDADFILKILFLFSVIGNQPKQKNQKVFRYLNREAELNYSEPLIVHKGLYKALQIL